MSSTWTLRGLGCVAAVTAASLLACALGGAAAAENPAARPGERRAAPQAAEKRAAEKRPARAKELTFDDIKFEMDKEQPFERSMITEDIEKLAGKRVRIHGYIFPTFVQQGITEFVLVRDNLECCFGPGAALYDCIMVKMKADTSTDYTTRPVAVEGTFKIEVVEDPIDPEARPLVIYQLDGEAVE